VRWFAPGSGLGRGGLAALAPVDRVLGQAEVCLEGLHRPGAGHAHRLLAGAEKAKPAALALATLVPALDDERPRFGRATLGEWSEVAEVAHAAERQRQLAALRPWLLWLVLLAGVAGLAFMVWRLTRPTTPQRGAGP